MKERVKMLMKRMLLPNAIVLGCAILVSAFSLFWVFYYRNEESPLSYVVYVFSFYTLSVTTYRVVLILRGFSIRKEKEKLGELHPILRRYFQASRFHFLLNFSLSLPLNILYAVLKTLYGIYIHSNWVLQNGVYYFLLTVMRVAVTYGAIKGGEKEKFALKSTALILSLSSIHYFHMVMEMYYNASFPHYPGYMVYLASLYSFVKVGSAIKGFVSKKGVYTPALKAGTVLKVCHAFVSLIFMESGMLNIFGSGSQEEKLILLLSGSVVALMVLLSGPLLLFWEKKRK